MPTIQVIITGKMAIPVEGPIVVCGNSDYSVKFYFDSEWDSSGQKIIAIDYRQRGHLRRWEGELDGDTIELPTFHETDALSINILSESVETDVPAIIPCAKCATDWFDSPAEERHDVYCEIMEMLANHGAPIVLEYELADADGYLLLDASGAQLTVKG